MHRGSEERAANWKRLQQEYRNSGLSRKAFCWRFKLKLSTLDYWFARLRREVEPQGLVELKGMASGPAAGSCLTLVTPAGIRVEVGPGCDLKLLGEVVRLLGSQP